MKNYLSFITESKSSKEEEMVEFMDSFMEGMKTQLGSKSHPDSLFYYKGDNEVYMELDMENGTLWVSCSKIWRFFESKFKLNYSEIQSFITRYMEDGYHLKGIHTFFENFFTEYMLEEKYHLKGILTLDFNSSFILPD